MREIKFRALSICKGERWVYGDLRHYARNPHTEKWTIHDPATGLETDIDETTIGQYTGMHDRSGKEIYEGDIFHLGDPNIRYVVVYRDCGLIGRQIGSSSTVGIPYWSDSITIIGNLYETVP